MDISPAGLIGASLGFLIGLVDYKAVTGIVFAKMRNNVLSAPLAEREKIEKRISFMKPVLFVATVLAFPVVGYLAGATWIGRS